jgi:hypothetical protein
MLGTLLTLRSLGWKTEPHSRPIKWPLFDVLGIWEKLGVFFFPFNIVQYKISNISWIYTRKKHFPNSFVKKMAKFVKGKEKEKEKEH